MYFCRNLAALKNLIQQISPLRKQLIKFTLIGILAVLVDLSCYYVLLNLLPEKSLLFMSNEALAKTISFLCGMGVTYTFNKLWTWKQKDRSKKRLAKFAMLYGLSLVVNVSINSLMLYVLHSYESLSGLPYKYLIAFAMATGISASLNFMGQKFWVFHSELNAAANLREK